MHDGATIRATRDRLRLSRVELARILGCDPTTIYRLEQHGRKPSARVAQAIDGWMRRATRAA